MDKELVLKSIEVLWKGMLAIFVAITCIFLAIAILNAISKRKKTKKLE